MSEQRTRSRLSRILVVEDHPTERRLLLDLLSHEGFEVVGCSTASDALEYVQRNEVGVAVVDLQLPDSSGTQLVELLRAKRDETRVIIYTGNASYQSAKEALNLGAFAYVEKVGDPGELLRHVHRAEWNQINRYATEMEQAVADRNRAQRKLALARDELESRVQERTADLDRANAALHAATLERGEIEAALQRSEARFRLFADAVSDVLWMSGLEPARPVFVNPAFERIWGYPVKTLYDNPALWMESIHPDDRPRIHHEMECWLLGPPECRFEVDYRIIRADGQLRWIRNRGVKVLAGEGRLASLTGVAADVSDRKLVELALREREQELVHALEAREVICRDLHDGALQSLYSVGLGLEASKSFLREDVPKATEHLEHAILQLNAVMREVRYFIAGLDSEVLIAGDLQTTLENLVGKLTRSTPVRFTVTLDAEAATHLSRTQKMQLLYIVQEAVSNSLRHARASAGEIALARCNGSLRLTIRDDGAGFDVTRFGSEGYGLSNMAARARKIGASLRIQSCAGKGTAVVVNFPVDP